METRLVGDTVEHAEYNGIHRIAPLKRDISSEKNDHKLPIEIFGLGRPVSHTGAPPPMSSYNVSKKIIVFLALQELPTSALSLL
jgi:hypothetical protein